MKLFTNKDFTFCDHKCKKQDKCRRHLSHYPQWKEDKYISKLLVEDINTKCQMFIKI